MRTQTLAIFRVHLFTIHQYHYLIKGVRAIFISDFRYSDFRYSDFYWFFVTAKKKRKRIKAKGPTILGREAKRIRFAFRFSEFRLANLYAWCSLS